MGRSTVVDRLLSFARSRGLAGSRQTAQAAPQPAGNPDPAPGRHGQLAPPCEQGSAPVTQQAPRTQDSGLRTQHSALSTQDSGFRTQDSALRTQHPLAPDPRPLAPAVAVTDPWPLAPAVAVPQHSGLSTQDSVFRTQDSAPLGAESILCDQAVFTSVRSGVSEGYRIIAASPGVTAAEKVEITRRCPSHGALCQDDPEAVGLEAYALPSKRHCVAFCCYAGCEHTARGGQRVYTHVVILDRAAWRRFQANPVTVHAALAQLVQSAGPILKPATRLDKIALTPPPPMVNLPVLAADSGGAAASPASGYDAVDCALTATADLLAGRQLILLDAPNPYRLLEKVLLSLPEETRETLDCSIDVKFSPARRMDLVLTCEPHGELQRRIAGLSVQLRHVSQTLQQTASALPFEAWERLLRRWWREGRRQDIQRLTGELCRGVSSEALDRVAAICEDTDTIANLSAEQVNLLLARYADAAPATRAEQILVDELQQAACERLASLQGATSN